MTVFAIDDEPLMIDLLVDAIKEAYPEIEPVTFERPSELLEKARETVPDVVFLDIEMPGMDGLSLAKALKDISPTVNIIFVSGFLQYSIDAFKIYASGYLVKPVCAEDIKNELSNLRYKKTPKSVKIKTFGNFSVSVSGVPVKFRLSKSMEMLAYLIDREGSTISKKEIGAVIYESDDYSRALQAEITRVARWLEEDLISGGANDVFRRDNGTYSINPDSVECDLYEYLKGGNILFTGEYMEQYSWAEYRKCNL